MPNRYIRQVDLYGLRRAKDAAKRLDNTRPFAIAYDFDFNGSLTLRYEYEKLFTAARKFAEEIDSVLSDMNAEISLRNRYFHIVLLHMRNEVLYMLTEAQCVDGYAWKKVYTQPTYFQYYLHPELPF